MSWILLGVRYFRHEWRVDLCRDHGESDAARVVASERVIRNSDAVLVAAIDKVSVSTGIDPLDLLG